MRPKIENSDLFLVESSPILFFVHCIYLTLSQHTSDLGSLHEIGLPQFHLMLQNDSVKESGCDVKASEGHHQPLKEFSTKRDFQGKVKRIKCKSGHKCQI